MKGELVRVLRVEDNQIFLDSDDLTDLRDLLSSVAEPDSLILLLTEGVLSRPWCLLELHAAVIADVPIIIVPVGNSFACDPIEAFKVLEDLPAYLAKTNKDAEAVLQAYGQSSNTIGTEIISGIAASDRISFDSHQSSAVLDAQVAQIAAAMVERACPETAPLLVDIGSTRTESWPTVPPNKVGIYILHEATTFATEQARDIKLWLQRRSDLVDSQIVTSDAKDAIDVGLQADLVVLLQTKNVLSDAQCLSQMYIAAKTGVSISPVFLTSKLRQHQDQIYDFDGVAFHLEKLSATLTASSARQIVEATGVSAETVGMSLGLMLPNIISKPLACDGFTGERDAQLAQIEATLRTIVSVRKVASVEEAIPRP